MRPILYSFRRCPYAMRARLALKYSRVDVELREVDLNNIPDALESISTDKTVPVLQLVDDTIIEESWDIAKWATTQNDADNWRGENDCYIDDAEMLVEMNDFSFKEDLDHYKYADRYPEHPMEYYRELGEEFLQELESRLSETNYLSANSISITDIAIFPFVRQFAFVDKDWFDQAPYPKLQHWLQMLLTSTLFEAIMVKHPVWQIGDEPVQL